MVMTIESGRPRFTPFRVDVHPERETVRVAPVGELDLATTPTLESQLDALRADGFDRIVLDLRELEFIDSTGIRLLVHQHRLASRHGLHFSLIAGSPEIQRVLHLCGLDDALPFRTA